MNDAQLSKFYEFYPYTIDDSNQDLISRFRNTQITCFNDILEKTSKEVEEVLTQQQNYSIYVDAALDYNFEEVD